MMTDCPFVCLFWTAVVCHSLVGQESIKEEPPSLGGEDFAFYGLKIPTALFFLGIRNETAGSVHGLHSHNFRIDEEALPIGAAFHASLALHYLHEHGVKMSDRTTEL